MYFMTEQSSRRGSLHAKRNIGNQDSVCTVVKNNICALCLADGAGSRTMSEIGAEHMTSALCQYLIDHFSELYAAPNETVRDNVMDFISGELDALAQKQKAPRSQFASTVVFAVTDGERYAIGHLGDGCILCLYENSGWNVMSFPTVGQNANATYLTTSALAREHLYIERGQCGAIIGFLLASDGILPYVFGRSFAYQNKLPLTQAFAETTERPTLDDASYTLCTYQKESP